MSFSSNMHVKRDRGTLTLNVFYLSKLIDNNTVQGTMIIKIHNTEA